MPSFVFLYPIIGSFIFGVVIGISGGLSISHRTVQLAEGQYAVCRDSGEAKDSAIAELERSKADTAQALEEQRKAVEEMKERQATILEQANKAVTSAIASSVANAGRVAQLQGILKQSRGMTCQQAVEAARRVVQ